MDPRPRPGSTLLVLVLALVASCDGDSVRAAELEPVPAPEPPEVIEVHPLVTLERALDDPATTKDELWRLGVEVFAWDVAASGDLDTIPDHEVRAWLEQDLRLCGVGDWPYETAYANFRGSSPGTPSH